MVSHRPHAFNRYEIKYLIDELHAYECDFSDALSPVHRDARDTFASVGVLNEPVSTEEFREYAIQFDRRFTDLETLVVERSQPQPSIDIASIVQTAVQVAVATVMTHMHSHSSGQPCVTLNPAPAAQTLEGPHRQSIPLSSSVLTQHAAASTVPLVPIMAAMRAQSPNLGR